MKMGLLVFMRNLLLALCLFLVLGFLYYSAWKLHLLRWEDTSAMSQKPLDPVTRIYTTNTTPDSIDHITFQDNLSILMDCGAL